MPRTSTLNSSELIDLIATSISRLDDWQSGFGNLLKYINGRITAGRGFVRLNNYLTDKYFDSTASCGGNSDSVTDGIFRQLREDKNPIAIPSEYSDYMIGEKQYSIIGIPISKNGDYLGAIVLTDNNQSGIRESQLHELLAFSTYLVPLFESAVLQEILVTSYIDTIETLAMALEAKDKYTRGHSNMVCAYATAIARKMGFSGNKLRNIEIGSMMHDIGKIGIPDEILTKPGRLTDEEFKIMKKHPVIGEEILKPMQHSMFEIPRKIVRWHHEQPDGNGYPDGISGDDVIIECRITLVADAYDAMTSDRPYRNGLAQDVAFAELRKYAGTQFDGDVIEALYELMMPKAEPHE